ncbi:MAG: anhydro-N-acetylmuramic acid kinase, partial [Kangiellaceae bacterium]|nr:anhydro-N-acetylmuramic acid kinase [Kangiellaceae bacterium]
MQEPDLPATYLVENNSMQKYIGLISGTSADSIDAILIEIDSDRFNVLAELNYPYPEQVKAEILNIAQPAIHNGEQRIDRLGHLDEIIGELFSQAAIAVCEKANCSLTDITAIGSHGQTVRHRPQGKHHFSMQIGDANIIAYKTGVTTVADFRRMDLAAGGQGAPLVPLFHQWLLGTSDRNRAILNLGGIANLTWLPKNQGQVIGFDTGPANALTDYWIKQKQGKEFDENGEWSKQGFVHAELLKHMMADPYFLMPAPKSTGREYFDAQWLEQKLKGVDPASDVDIQATLVDLTAKTVCEHIVRLPDHCDELLVCGGGAHNQHLMTRLDHYLHPKPEIAVLDGLGINSDFIEAATFAWLAKQRLDNNRLDYSAV